MMRLLVTVSCLALSQGYAQEINYSASIGAVIVTDNPNTTLLGSATKGDVLSVLGRASPEFLNVKLRNEEGQISYKDINFLVDIQNKGDSTLSIWVYSKNRGMYLRDEKSSWAGWYVGRHEWVTKQVIGQRGFTWRLPEAGNYVLYTAGPSKIRKAHPFSVPPPMHASTVDADELMTTPPIDIDVRHSYDPIPLNFP
ncbi:hypothetical protein [Roseimaritima ulvae]|nr:hypothetical protein [Roseimaritima ulvae]